MLEQNRNTRLYHQKMQRWEEAVLPVLTWDGALERLSEIDPLLSASIEAAHAFYKMQKRIPGGDESPFLARYEYGEDIFDAGDLRFPRNEAAQIGTYRTKERVFSIGVVMDGVCEVQPQLNRYPSGHRVANIPEALLRRGEMLGIFEFLDEFSGKPFLSKPDWTITSGSVLTRSPDKLNTAKVKKLLQRNVPSIDFGQESRAGSILRRIVNKDIDELGGKFAENWHTSILFLPKDFIHWLLEADLRDTHEGIDYLLLVLFSKGWLNKGRTDTDFGREVLRVIQDSERSRFNAANGNARYRSSSEEKNQQVAAARLAAYIMEALSRTRPVFFATATNDEYGPFLEGSRIFESCARSPFLLRPGYLPSVSDEEGENDTAFVPLADIDPDYFNSSGGKNPMRVKLTNVCKIIRAAMSFEPDVGDNPLSINRAAFENSLFRVPTDMASKKDAESEACVLRISSSLEDEVAIVEESEEKFFEGALEAIGSIEDRPGDRAQFFRSCLRLSRGTLDDM